MRFPSSTKVQTLLFPAESWSASSARAWARSHGFKAPAVDRMGKHLRLRQADPDLFEKGTFRTISLGHSDIKAVVAVPKVVEGLPASSRMPPVPKGFKQLVEQERRRLDAARGEEWAVAEVLAQKAVARIVAEFDLAERNGPLSWSAAGRRSYESGQWERDAADYLLRRPRRGTLVERLPSKLPTPEVLFDAMREEMLASPPPGVSRAYMESFFRRRGGDVLVLLRRLLLSHLQPPKVEPPIIGMHMPWETPPAELAGARPPAVPALQARQEDKPAKPQAVAPSSQEQVRPKVAQGVLKALGALGGALEERRLHGTQSAILAFTAYQAGSPLVTVLSWLKESASADQDPQWIFEGDVAALLGMVRGDLHDFEHEFCPEEDIERCRREIAELQPYLRAVEEAVAGTATPTWEGGVAGRELRAYECAEGRRVVVLVDEDEGLRHGTVAKLVEHRWRISAARMVIGARGIVPEPTEPERIEVDFTVRIVLDAGRTVEVRGRNDEPSFGSKAFEELRPATKPTAKDVRSGQAWVAPKDVWKDVVNAHSSIGYAQRKADAAKLAAKKAEWRQAAARARKRAVEALALWTEWQTAEGPRYGGKLPTATHPWQERLIALDLREPRTSREDMELSILRQVPEDWRTRVKVGDPVKTWIDGKLDAGWWLAEVHADLASLVRAKPAEGTVPLADLVVHLWMVQRDHAAAVRVVQRPAASSEGGGVAPPTFTFLEVAKANGLGDHPYVIEIAKVVLKPGKYGSYPDRGAVSKAVKRFLAAHGIDVRTRVASGVGVTGIDLDFPRAKPAEVAHYAGLPRWYDDRASFEPWEKGGAAYDPYADYQGKGAGMTVPAKYLVEFATFLAGACKEHGQALSDAGEELLAAAAVGSGAMPVRSGGGATPEQRQAAAEGCADMEFDVEGHGRVRVVCGQRGKRDTWHNVWIGSVRYGYNGGRWARGMKPPQAVLAALAERGVSVFGG